MTARTRSALLAAALTIGLAMPAAAQVSHETKVSTDVSHQDGVTTRTTKVAHIRKVKTNRPKRILGVKVGHKTRTTKTVDKTSVSTDGDYSHSVSTSH